MTLLEQLATTLRQIGKDAIETPLWGDPEALRDEHRRIVAWLGVGSGTIGPTDDRVAIALETFIRTDEMESMGQARLISYGCTQRFNGSRSLIENRKHFSLLLDYVDSNHEQTRPFRKCYRGLLHGYFCYDPTAETALEDGRKNWQDLRGFLVKRRAQLAITETDPEWVGALNGHANLLDDDTCRPYGAAALRGDRSAFDEMRAKLEVRDDSWVINSFIDAQVEAVVSLPDDFFKNGLQFVLPLIKEHPLVADRSLGKLINRYAACRTHEVSVGLRDFSVLQWKNPWLPSNAARWGSVEIKARDMIADWLKLQLITQFFSLLSEDGMNDKRRVDFWKGYHEKITDMYFALGNTAYTNRSKDFEEIRKSMDGRLMRLSNTAPTNNAFIMMIGDYVVVEFGETKNAAYIFRSTDEMPFKLSGVVSGNFSELKNKRSTAFVDCLIHRDTNDGPWEDLFARILSKRVGRRPAHSPRTYLQERPVGDPVRDDSAVEALEATLEAIADQHDLIVTDNRSKGGAIWVKARLWLAADAKARLEALGFRWSERRAAYHKSE